jgi:predicted outer membrane repeat protein
MKINVTNNNNSGSGSLRDAVDIANENPGFDYITIDHDINRINIDSALSIDSNLAIDGQGVIIDANGGSRIFEIEPTWEYTRVVDLDNMTLQNGKASREIDYTSKDADYANRRAARGGAIISGPNSNVSISDVSFINNEAQDGGGAVYSGWTSDLNVDDCLFYNNSGSGSNDERGGGAIDINQGTLTVTDSEFTDNVGINGGAINALQSSLKITGTLFENNSTCDATKDNQIPVPKANLRGFGGAIYVDLASRPQDGNGIVKIDDSQFVDNDASNGGAMYVYNNSNDSLFVTDSDFIGNTVDSYPSLPSGSGGAIDAQSNSKGRAFLEDNLFQDNSAEVQGGAVRIRNYDSLLSRNSFVDNASENTGGALTFQSQNSAFLRVHDSLFVQNFAENSAGAINAINSADRVRIGSSTFVNNSNDSSWGGYQHTDALFSGFNNFQFGSSDSLATLNVNVLDSNPLL